MVGRLDGNCLDDWMVGWLENEGWMGEWLNG